VAGPGHLGQPKDLKEARALQEALRQRVRLRPLRRRAVRLVAAVDCAFLKDWGVAAACLWSLQGLELLREAFALQKAPFPYVPGYLTFREAPAMLRALGGLGTTPHVVLIDGQGIAHPRGLGLASHVGVLLGLPTVGCAKSLLVGSSREPGPKRGSFSVIEYNSRVVGAALRTKDSTRCVYVSPGHLLNLRDALWVVLKSSSGSYRLPEPLRWADARSRQLKKRLANEGRDLHGADLQALL